MEFIQAGKTQLRVSAFKDWTFEEFKSQYKGLVSVDLKKLWSEIELANGTSSKSDTAVGETDKSFKRKKYNDVPFPKRGV